MAVNKNVLRYYIRSDGTFFPATENSGKIYPGSAYANLLDIYLEDGISENTFVQVSFLIDGKFVTEWLPTFQQGTETRVIENVSVPFGVFRIAIPPNVTQNASPTATKQVGISVRQVYGEAWQGVFDDYDTLVSEVPPTETLAVDYATAYVLTTVGDDEYGFYQCQYDADTDTYLWVAVTIANTYQEIKTYGVGNATLQKGWVSPKGTVTISDAIQNLIFIELSNIEQRVTTLETAVDDLDLDKLEKDFGEYDPKTTYNGTDTIAINDDEDGGDPKEMALSDLMEAENMSFDNTATDLEATTVQDAIEELETDIIAVDDKVDMHIADETNPHNVTATQVAFTPSVDPAISSETVQEAIEEVQGNLDDYETDNDARVLAVEDDIEDILDGTQTVKKAERDASNNVITTTYETKADATTHKNDTTNPHEVTKTQVGLGNVTDNAQVKKRATSTNGNVPTWNGTTGDALNDGYGVEATLTGGASNLPRADAVKDYIDDSVTDHDESETAHTYIRGLIEDLEQNVSRLDGRGKSYGEVPYTTAQMTAFDAATRASNIKAYIEAQDWFDGTYTPSSGDLVYDQGVGDGVNYHEWEFNDTAWVDNGAIASPKASNTIFGTVNGSGDYVDIIAGIIQVLLADNATYLKKATTADKYTYEDIFNALANRYIKAETYSQAEVDALLAGLTSSYGLQSTLLTPTPLTDTDTLTTADMADVDFVVFTAVNSDTGEVDSDMVSSDTIVTGKKFVFFDNEDYSFTIGETDSTFSTASTDVTLKVNAISSNVSIIQPLTSVTTEPVTAEDGDKYFNSSTSTIWEYQTDEWVDSEEEPGNQKIYTFDGSIYVWSGSELVMFESDMSAYVDSIVGDRTYTEQNVVADEETVTESIDALDQEVGRLDTDKAEDSVVVKSVNGNEPVAGAVDVDHNDLSNKQGGTTDEYYHLTSEQVAKLESFDFIELTDVSDTDPTSPDEGDIYYNYDDETLYKYTDSAWVEESYNLDALYIYSTYKFFVEGTTGNYRLMRLSDGYSSIYLFSTFGTGGTYSALGTAYTAVEDTAKFQQRQERNLGFEVVTTYDYTVPTDHVIRFNADNFTATETITLHAGDILLFDEYSTTYKWRLLRTSSLDATTTVKGVGLLSSVTSSDGFGENDKLVTETHAKLIYDDLDSTCDYLLGLLEA